MMFFVIFVATAVALDYSLTQRVAEPAELVIMLSLAFLAQLAGALCVANCYRWLLRKHHEANRIMVAETAKRKEDLRRLKAEVEAMMRLSSKALWYL